MYADDFHSMQNLACISSMWCAECCGCEKGPDWRSVMGTEALHWRSCEASRTTTKLTWRPWRTGDRCALFLDRAGASVCTIYKRSTLNATSHMCSILAGGVARAKMGGGGGLFQPERWSRRLARGEVHRDGCLGLAAHPLCEISSPRWVKGSGLCQTCSRTQV